MGNSESEVDNSLKAQAGGAGSPELYKWIAVGGGGIIFDAMKEAMLTKDFSEVDSLIQNEIPKYLYNDGEGDMLPIKDFVLKRADGRAIPPQLGKIPVINPHLKEPDTKEHCWRHDMAGAVGESLLHVCMLMGSPIHIELCKRLLLFFPRLINDIYLSEMYYGENVLHMAIVSEDPALTKYFLACGANVHQRASGKFFTPDDQKSSRVNNLEQEAALLSIETNYECLSYFGEYPLSFAAILNQHECIRLLIAYNADPNRQDSNGNTVLHMMVIKNNLEMFDFMLQFDVRLDIKNNQGLTPLSLAAKLARKEMFDFILEKLRKIEWHYADISCAAYPLDTIDTIRPNGQIDTTSSIYSICFGESEEHLELLEGYITNLIHVKWETFIKQQFYIEVAVYLVYFFLSGLVLILKRRYFDYLEEGGCVYISSEGKYVMQDICPCASLYPNDPNAKFRIFCEILLWLFSLGYVLLIIGEIYIQGVRMYAQNLLINPFKISFMCSLVLTMLEVPFRYACVEEADDYLTPISIIMKSLYILYLGRGFTRICTFVYIIHQTIKTQLSVFLIIWMIFAMGFGQSFYISFGFGAPPVHEVFTTPLVSLMTMVVALVNDVGAIYHIMLVSTYPVVGRVLFIAAMIMGGVMMLNLLIAMMAHTYDVTHELEREPMRQWARQVLLIEQNIPLKNRLKEQKKYAHFLLNGDKTFMVRYKQTQEEHHELMHEVKVFFKKQNQQWEEEEKMKCLE